MLYIVQLYGNKPGLPQSPWNGSLSWRARLLSAPYVPRPGQVPNDPRKGSWGLICLQTGGPKQGSQPEMREEVTAKTGRYSLPSVLHKPVRARGPHISSSPSGQLYLGQPSSPWSFSVKLQWEYGTPKQSEVFTFPGARWKDSGSPCVGRR